MFRNARPEQLAFLDAGGEVTEEKRSSAREETLGRRSAEVRLGRRPRLSGSGSSLTTRGIRTTTGIRCTCRCAREARAEPAYRAHLRRDPARSSRTKRQGARGASPVQRDHVHLIVEGRTAASSPITCAASFAHRPRREQRGGRSGASFAIATTVTSSRDRRRPATRSSTSSSTSASTTRRTAALLSESTLTSSTTAAPSPPARRLGEDARPPPELLAQLRRRASDLAGGELPVSAPGTWLAPARLAARARRRAHVAPRAAAAFFETRPADEGADDDQDVRSRGAVARVGRGPSRGPRHVRAHRPRDAAARDGKVAPFSPYPHAQFAFAQSSARGQGATARRASRSRGRREVGAREVGRRWSAPRRARRPAIAIPARAARRPATRTRAPHARRSGWPLSRFRSDGEASMTGSSPRLSLAGRAWLANRVAELPDRDEAQ